MTSARIFDIAYGGEGKFTTTLGRWLANRNIGVTIIGSGFTSPKTKHLSRNQEEIKPEMNSKKVRALNPPYIIYAFSRLVMSILWILRILSLNSKIPISLIHAQDTGYAGLAAVLSGKILKVPVIISSHGIRHKSLESIIHGRLKRLLLRTEYILDTFTIKNADKILVDNSAIKDYFEKITQRDVEFIPIPIKTDKFQFSQLDRNMMRQELGIDEKAVGSPGTELEFAL